MACWQLVRLTASAKATAGHPSVKTGALRPNSTHGFDKAACGGDRRRRFPGTLQPRQIGLLAKPDQLPARVAAVLLCDERARRGLVPDTAQMLERLTIHQSAEGTRGFRNAACQQRSDLVQQPALEL